MRKAFSVRSGKDIGKLCSRAARAGMPIDEVTYFLLDFTQKKDFETALAAREEEWGLSPLTKDEREVLDDGYDAMRELRNRLQP